MAKPDFSGEWILNRKASTLSPGADAVRSGVWRIEHREPTFRHQAAFVFEKGKREYEYELQSDGPEVVGSEDGARTIGSLRWEGDALVVLWRTERTDGEMSIAFRYELLDAARRLQACEEVRGSAWDQDNVWVFDRG
jgi:hypothetical protein